MKIQKYFEVKTGKNKGFYIVTKAPKLESKRTYKALARIWGMLVADYNYGFYSYHGVNTANEVIWTHTRYMSHEYTRKVYNELLKKFNAI